MRNTSSAYKKQIKGIREFCAKIIINYADSSTQTLTDLQDFKQLKFVDECSGNSEFELGAAVIGEAVITLNNRTGKFDNKNFYGAHISAYSGILVDGKPELLEMGHYIVDEPVSPGISIALTAYDNMILLEKPYVPGITYPATLGNIAKDACTQCGVILESSDFPRNSYVVEYAPENATCREVLAAVAQLAGCFAKARANGRIALAWYAAASSLTVDTLRNKSICTDDVTITGITVSKGESTAQAGADGYRLSIIDNILLEESKIQETANYLASKLVGLSFRPLSVSCQSDPSIEAGDRITVKDGDATYATVVTSTTFAVLEAQKVACNAASPTVNAGKRLSETSKAIIANRKYTDEAMEHERSERETALDDLNRQLAEASGMYTTAQKQEDGSTIYYTHDKPELKDSKVVWKLTATALGISTDGGKTYPIGLDVSGTAILNRIYVTGIDGKYIKIENEKLSEYVEKISQTAEDAKSNADDAKKKAEDATNTANKTVASMSVEYYKSTSATELKGGTWQSGAVTATQGYYIWSRTKTTAQDGTVTYSQPACITGSTGATGAKGDTGAAGAKGDTGATGKGVKSIVPQYYLSTSKTSQTDGSWSNTQPTWQPSHYIWTRSYITWSDGTTSTTTPILAQALNDANEKGYNNSQELETVKKTVSTQGSSITTMENQIKEKVWQSDITTEIKKIGVGGRNLAQGQSKEWQSFKPATGVNQCHSFLKSGTVAAIDTSASAGLSVTCVVELKWENCASQSGQTMKVWAQGSQDGAWTCSNPFCNGLFNFAPSASGQQIFKTTAVWDGKAHRYDIGMRCDYSDGNGTFYWRCLKAELGTIATDWTPAPEDVQADIDTAQTTADGVRTTVTQTRTEVEALKTSTESLTTAMREYTKTTDFEAYKKQVTSQLSQTPEAITARFKTLEETVSKQGADSSSKWQELENYIQFSSTGITLGRKDDPLTLVLDNGQICFMQSGQKVAWFTNNQLYISNATVTTAATIVGLKISRSGRHIQIS